MYCDMSILVTLKSRQLLNSPWLGMDSYRSERDRCINYAHGEDVCQTFMQMTSTLKFKDGCERDVGDGYGINDWHW